MPQRVVPVLLAMAFVPVVMAADPLPRSTIGFEYGAAATLYNDSRLEGLNTNFAILFAVGQYLNIGVYRETGYIHGEENNSNVEVDTTIHELRIGLDIWRNETHTQDVSVMMGYGYAKYDATTPSIHIHEMVADLTARYTPVRVKSGPVIGAVTVNAGYRYASLDNRDFGLTRRVDNLGGFVIGLGAGLSF